MAIESNVFMNLVQAQQQQRQQMEIMQKARDQATEATRAPRYAEQTGARVPEAPTEAGHQDNFAAAHMGGSHIVASPEKPASGYGLAMTTFAPTKGYALDMHRNGRYDAGRDGVLVFDQNRDGRYDNGDVQNTSNMMRAAAGNIDTDGDGVVSAMEKAQAEALQARYGQLDGNKDGKLDTGEISTGGGKIWVNRSADGQAKEDELFPATRFPSANGAGGTQRLDYVDPTLRSSHTSEDWGKPTFGYPGGTMMGGFGGLTGLAGQYPGRN